MTESLRAKIEGMKQMARELESIGATSWENLCGYKINEELALLINLPEEGL